MKFTNSINRLGEDPWASTFHYWSMGTQLDPKTFSKTFNLSKYDDKKRKKKTEKKSYT